MFDSASFEEFKLTNIYALFCLVSSYFVYKYILKDIYHHFKDKGVVQETRYEASYVVPSTQYDRIEGPKFRRRNIKSAASGTGTARDADSRRKHSFKNRDTKEQVPLPFPAGRNTYQIMSARPSNLPTVASSVLVESSAPLPIGCQRKIPELPYDFFGDSAEKSVPAQGENKTQSMFASKKSRKISPPKFRRKPNIFNTPVSPSMRKPFSPFVSPVKLTSRRTPIHLSLKKENRDLANDIIGDVEVYNIVGEAKKREKSETNQLLPSSQIYRALSQSPVDRAMDDAAKLEQSREVNFGEIEREVQVNLLSQQVSGFATIVSSSSENTENVSINAIHSIDKDNRVLSSTARKEMHSRIDLFERKEKERNEVVNAAQELLNKMHRDDLRAKRLEEEKVRAEQERKERQRQKVLAEKKEKERLALETKRIEEDKQNKKREEQKKQIEEQKKRIEKEEANANAVLSKRKSQMANFKDLAEAYDRRATKADQAKGDPSTKHDAKTIRRAINKLSFVNNKGNVQSVVQNFVNIQNTSNNPVLKDYSRVHMIRKILDENHELTAKKENRPSTYETIFHRGQLILEISLLDSDFCSMFLGAIGSLREFQLQDKSLKRFPWLFRDDLLIYDVDEVNKRLAADNANITKLTNVIASHASLYAAFVQGMPMNGSTGNSHPHGISHAWIFVSKILNLDKTRILSYHNFGIYYMLLLSSHRLYRTYKKQFIKLAKLVRSDFMSHVENQVDDAWHNPKHLGSFKIFMDEMASFLDEAVLPASPSGALVPQTPIPEKLIFIEFHHNNVMLRDLENINNKKWSIGALPIGHFQRLPDHA